MTYLESKTTPQLLQSYATANRSYAGDREELLRMRNPQSDKGTEVMKKLDAGADLIRRIECVLISRDLMTEHTL